MSAAMTTSTAVRQWALITRQVAVFIIVGPPVGGVICFDEWALSGVMATIAIAILSYLTIVPVVMAGTAGLLAVLSSRWLYRQRTVNPLIHICIGAAWGFSAALLMALLVFPPERDEPVLDGIAMLMARCGFFAGAISAFVGWIAYLRDGRGR